MMIVETHRDTEAMPALFVFAKTFGKVPSLAQAQGSWATSKVHTSQELSSAMTTPRLMKTSPQTPTSLPRIAAVDGGAM